MTNIKIGDLSDLSDIRPELVSQLTRRTKSRNLELVEVISAIGETASIDEILVGLYRKTKRVEYRANVSNRLHRLVKKGLLISVEGQTGVYGLSKSTGA